MGNKGKMLSQEPTQSQSSNNPFREEIGTSISSYSNMSSYSNAVEATRKVKVPDTKKNHCNTLVLRNETECHGKISATAITSTIGTHDNCTKKTPKTKKPTASLTDIIKIQQQQYEKNKKEIAQKNIDTHKNKKKTKNNKSNKKNEQSKGKTSSTNTENDKILSQRERTQQELKQRKKFINIQNALAREREKKADQEANEKYYNEINVEDSYLSNQREHWAPGRFSVEETKGKTGKN